MPDLNTFPHLHLLVSGGNSQIIYLQSWQKWQIIGQTLDDAAGECLDKIGRMIGLDYPGGVNLAKIAEIVDQNWLEFPIGMKNQNRNQGKNSENTKNQSKSQIKTRKLNSFLANSELKTELTNLIKTNVENQEVIKEIVEKSKENIKSDLELLENDQKNNLDLENLERIPSEKIEGKMETLANFNLNYSFSGLKTAVRYFVQKQKFENWNFEKKLTKNENLILQNWQEIQTFIKQKQKEKNENLENIEQIQPNNNQNYRKILQIAQKYLQNLQENSANLLKNDLERVKTKFENQIRNKNNLADLVELKNERKDEEVLKLFHQELQNIQTEDWQKLELFYKICVSGQSVVITQLTAKLKLAIEILKPKSLGISGGVSANLLLRQKIENLAKDYQMELFIPIQSLTGDNAVMIALAGLADIWAENHSKSEQTI